MRFKSTVVMCLVAVTGVVTFATPAQASEWHYDSTHWTLASCRNEVTEALEAGYEGAQCRRNGQQAPGPWLDLYLLY